MSQPSYHMDLFNRAILYKMFYQEVSCKKVFRVDGEFMLFLIRVYEAASFLIHPTIFTWLQQK